MFCWHYQLTYSIELFEKNSMKTIYQCPFAMTLFDNKANNWICDIECLNKHKQFIGVRSLVVVYSFNFFAFPIIISSKNEYHVLFSVFLGDTWTRSLIPFSLYECSFPASHATEHQHFISRPAVRSHYRLFSQFYPRKIESNNGNLGERPVNHRKTHHNQNDFVYSLLCRRCRLDTIGFFWFFSFSRFSMIYMKIHEFLFKKKCRYSSLSRRRLQHLPRSKTAYKSVKMERVHLYMNSYQFIW